MRNANERQVCKCFFQLKRSVRISLKSKITVLFLSQVAFVKFIKAIVKWGDLRI